MRHAKPAAKQAGMSDHDRLLDARGERDARLAGSFILGEQTVPELILSSTAARARATAEAVSQACGDDNTPLLLPELYLADLVICLDQIRALPDDCSTVMVVGHNPGLEELIEYLTGERCPLGTAALAGLRLPVEHWIDLGRMGSCELVRMWRP
jgi:phosphohistidine phosphatase